MKFLSIDDVDKTIYELIRREVVRLGYLPDVTQPNYVENREAMNNALDGGVIDVFGTGSWQSRGNHSGNRFVIDRYDVEKGRIGGGTIVEHKYTENGVDIVKNYRLPKFSQTITYEIRFTTTYNRYELLCNEVIARAFGENREHPCLSERDGTSGLSMLITKRGEYDTSGYDFYERVFTFAVEDLFLEHYVSEFQHRVNGVTYPLVDMTDFDIDVRDGNINTATDSVVDIELDENGIEVGEPNFISQSLFLSELIERSDEFLGFDPVTQTYSGLQ